MVYTKLFIQLLNYRYLGILTVIATMTRSIPAAEEWSRMEVEVGRFHHQNLLLLGWLEICLKIDDDVQMTLLERVVKSCLSRSPLH